MSSERLILQVHSLYFIAMGGANPVAVSLGVSCSPITEGVRKTRRLRREAALWFAPIGPLSRALAALGSLRSRMRQWPAQDGWYLIPVDHGRQFRRCFGSVVESYSQLDSRKAIQTIDLEQYSRERKRPDFTFSPKVNDVRAKQEVTSDV